MIFYPLQYNIPVKRIQIYPVKIRCQVNYFPAEYISKHEKEKGGGLEKILAKFVRLHVAVGMPVSRHPPHGSGLEELPHPALTLSVNALNRRSGKGWTKRGLGINHSRYFRYSFHLRFRALWLLLLSTRSHSRTHLV
jgi:hypothetical protein